MTEPLVLIWPNPILKALYHVGNERTDTFGVTTLVKAGVCNKVGGRVILTPYGKLRFKWARTRVRNKVNALLG